MSTFSRTLLITMSILLVLSFVDAGPFTLTFPMSVRNGRQIRAPFKNHEIMVARGYGKRDGSMSRDKMSSNSLEDLDDESIPIDWMAHELTANPALIRLLLHRFVDINHDGAISARELLGNSQDGATDIY
ncbi:allatotropins-like [Episyrphus balteatus]|uniref:allatotropins-like n=1 Tax=Episyrphus balteatus TaxID=286459 RepID=UPI002486A0BC|nr:allatotropins-like [Episyrphus balteatus]